MAKTTTVKKTPKAKAKASVKVKAKKTKTTVKVVKSKAKATPKAKKPTVKTKAPKTVKKVAKKAKSATPRNTEGAFTVQLGKPLNARLGACAGSRGMSKKNVLIEVLVSYLNDWEAQPKPTLAAVA